jgi:hypothetical protein
MGSDLPLEIGDKYMSELKTNERLALVRAEALVLLPALEDAAKIGTGTYIIVTEHGDAKITISAIKDENYNVDEEVMKYETKLATAAAKAEEKAAKAAAKA